MLYAVVTVLLVAPIFYYSTKILYLEEADEVLVLHKKQFELEHASILKQSDIDKWNEYNRDVKIEVDQQIKKDSLFDRLYFDPIELEDEPYRVLYAPISIEGKSYTLIVKTNLVEQEDLLEHIAILFLTLSVLLLAGFYFITKRISKSLWKPFYDTLSQIEAFEIDKLHQPEFVHTNVEEFNRLNQSIASLIEKNTSIYKTQKEFIENAAHELQTPLAVFQGKIDNLLQDPSFTREQFNELISLSDNVSKLKRLNKNLLLLSKLDRDVYLEKNELSFNELLGKTLVFFKEQAEAKGIQIEVKEEAVFHAKANAVLVEVLLNNLILNAIRHNVIGGELMIVLTKKSFTVVNSGIEQSLDNGKLFNRFSKINPSAKGNGLGLAIVKRIAELNNLTVEYAFKDNLHSFSVSVSVF